MRVLITGGSGYLAWELVRQMKAVGCYEIVVASSTPEKLKDDENYEGTIVIANEVIWDDNIFLKTIDIIVHTAFCRKSMGSELMDSLQFSGKLFQQAKYCKVRGLINISSQSVYGSEKEILPAENGKYAPGYLYSFAKATSELLMESIIDESETNYTAIRLASLVGPGKFIPINVLYKFVENALEGKTIHIEGGKQNFSFMDVRDAASAIIQLMEIPNKEWNKYYNLGPEKQINIKELAQMAVQYAVTVGGYPVAIKIKEDDTLLNAGMNSGKIYQTLNWKPQYRLQDTIAETGRYISYKKRQVSNTYIK